MATESPRNIRVIIDEDLAELIPGFLENRRTNITQMLTALANGDFDTIRAIGHDIKGSGGGYGFDAITEMGAALETAAKQQDGGAIRRHIDALRFYLDHIDIVYE